MNQSLLTFANTAHHGAQRARTFIVRAWRKAVQQEKVLATATFALIFATTISCLDYLVTGAPDWNPGGEAYAMDMVQTEQVVLRARPMSLAPLAPQAEQVEMVDYSYTEEVLLGDIDVILPVQPMLPGKVPVLAALSAEVAKVSAEAL